MNPSASGWIPKFLAHFEREKLIESFADEPHFYSQLKHTGFIYGVSVDSLPEEPVSHLQLTKEEYTKINLFHALLYTYFSQKQAAEFDDAINEIIRFYKNIEKGKKGFFQKLTPAKKPSENLEKILSARLQEGNEVLKKNTSSLLTFALLYVDVLAFRVFLRDPDGLKRYTDALEVILIRGALLALNSKEKKNEYDLQLLELFESSAVFTTGISVDDHLDSLERLQFLSNDDILERHYLLDICCLAVWDDHELDDSEHEFLKQLTAVLGLQQTELEHALNELFSFSDQHAEKIKLFEYAHPVNQFYKQSVSTVKLLILRNKNRLLKELEESGELLILLGQSTLRDLTKEEQQQVKEQLLDICKTIPSLAIFLLPGGGVLLPLLVKFIPKLLPSAFNENRIEKE